MLIDCNECVMQNTSACDDCIVSVLLRADQQKLALDSSETEALRALGEAGLVPRLRLLPRVSGDD
jgi:hypothetical protein